MSLERSPNEERREEMLRLVARAEAAERERDSMKARYEEARREAREARERFGAVSRASRDFTKSAREAAAGQHGLENELRANLARGREERSEGEKSRRRLEDLIDRLGGIAWEAEASGEGAIERLTFVGGHCEEILGYPRSRWLRSERGWFEVTHPDDRERVREAYALAIRESEAVSVEFRVFAADGRMMWIQDLINPFGPADESGHAGNGSTRLRGLMVDVTERKRAEVALRESEERLRSAISIETVGVVFFDLDERITDANEAFERMSGYSRDELLDATRGTDITAPEYIEATERAIEELAQSGKTAPYEKAFARKDGSRWWGLCAPRRLAGSGAGSECVEFILDITESKRAEASLRESEERLSAIFSHAAAGLSEISLDGRFTRVNDGLCEILGLSREEVLATSVADVTHPEDVNESLRAFERVVKTGESASLDKRYVRPGGEVVSANSALTRLDDEGGGRPRSILAVTVDLTERKRAEDALRESEERLSLALSAARMGNWDMNLRTREATRSPLHDRIFGYEEMLPEWSLDIFLDHVHPDDRDSVAEKFELSRETGEEWEFECRILRADGETRWIWALGTIQSEALGRHARMFGLVNDITERKEAEEKVRRSEERFRLLFEQATDAAFVHDLEGNFVQINDRACESLGYSREELLTKSVSDVEMNLVPGGFDEIWSKVSQTGDSILVEGMHRRKDGTTFPAEVNVGKFESEGERSMLALARDVTARKRVDAEREAALESERRARDHLAFLAEASRELASLLDLDETLARAARLAVPRVAEWCVVSVLADDIAGGEYRHRLATSFQTEAGNVDVRLENRLDEDTPEPVREVIRTGEPHLVENVDEAHLENIATGGEHLERLREFGLDSYVIVPLEARGRTFGTITFARSDPSRRYDRESLDLLGNFADRAALALENARLFERQRHTARVLQKSLLPAELPEIPGLDLAARLHPLGEGVEVGGDFYDLFHASEGRWAMAIGDILGKGPEAASVTSLARYTLRNEARHESVPSSVLEALNAAMLEQNPVAEDDRFCTVLFGNIHPKPGGLDIEFASGGHPLPVMLRSDGSVEEVGRHGTLLGIFDDPEISDSKVEVGRGEAIVFYTDGVTEARKDGELFGEERVKEAVASCVGRGADGIADCLEEGLREFSGGVLGDDAAILVIKVPE